MRTAPREIRLYCLCGLKMRITAEMYGKPGKCIGCREKFWVPKPEELPEDDNVIRLADHPELLRRAGDRVRSGTNAAEGDNLNDPVQPIPEVTPEMASKDSASGSGDMARLAAEERLAAGVDAASGAKAEEPSAPLDDLEPLRMILAYRHLVEKQPPDSASGMSPGQADTETRLAYRRLVERAKTRIDKRLRELLYDTGRRLVETLGEIAQTTLKFRVGEFGPDAYFEKVGKLRRRREWLDRQRVNLKNWLRTENVHLLGGPGGVTLEDLNLNNAEVFLPAEDNEERTLLKKHIGDLREAFDARAAAERRRSEWRRMAREDAMPEEALLDGPPQADADLQRAKARIMHARGRLRQVVKDCDADLSALQAYRQLPTKGALPPLRGELGQEKVLAEARTLSQALADLRQWRNWASNAANAEDAGDLPLSPPTVFRRLAEPNELRRFARESVPAYAAGLCLMLLALLPESKAGLGFLAGMVCMVLIPALSNRARRGVAYAVLWVAETFLMGLAWHFAAATPATQSYLSEPLHFAFMTAASLGAWLAMGVSAAMVLRKLAGGYVWATPVAGGLGILLFLTAVWLGGGPVPAPQPTATPVAAVAALSPTAEAATGNISPPAPPNPAEPSAVKPVPDAPTPVPAAAPVKTAVPIPPPRVAPPSATPVPEKNATEDAAPQDPPANTSPAGDASAYPPPAENAPLQLSRPTVELRGIMQKEGSPPRFRIILNTPAGRNRTMDLFLGETVYASWKALDYSPTSKKLTLSNAKRLVVLDTGRAVDLPE